MAPPCVDIPPAVVELSELQLDSFESVLRMNASLGSLTTMLYELNLVDDLI